MLIISHMLACGNMCSVIKHLQSYNEIFQTYLFWNITIGSFSRSLMSTCCPLFVTSECFFIISQPICEKKKPLRESCGSACVSVNLWCTLWSRTHSWILFCIAIVCPIANISRNGHFALNALWAHNRWAPPVIPTPATTIKITEI